VKRRTASLLAFMLLVAAMAAWRLLVQDPASHADHRRSAAATSMTATHGLLDEIRHETEPGATSLVAELPHPVAPAEPAVAEGYFAGFPADALAPMRVRGRVVQRTGDPLEGATILIVWADLVTELVAERHQGSEPPPDGTTTDALGRFDLVSRRLVRFGRSGDMKEAENMSPFVVVDDPRCATFVSDDLDDSLVDIDAGNLVVEPGARTAGRVVDTSGRPVSGARISWRNPWAVPDALSSTLSAHDGRFETRALSLSSAALDVEACGFDGRTLAHLPLIAGELNVLADIVLVPHDPAAGVIAGHVVDEQDRPLAGARVLLLGGDPSLEMPDSTALLGTRRSLEERPSFGTATTGADGAFRITGLGDEPRTIVAWSDRRMPAVHHAVRPDAGPLELRLLPEPVVDLRLQDAAGAPVDAEEIHVNWLYPNGATSDDLPVVREDVGRYAVSAVREDTLHVWVSVPGCAVTQADVQPDEQGVATLALARESAIEGRVVDDLGVPVPEACISFRHYGTDACDRSVVAAADGTFRLTRLVAGVWNADIAADGYPDESVGQFAVASGEHRTGEILVLPRGGEIRGRVVHQDSQAVRPSQEWGEDDGVEVAGLESTFDVPLSVTGEFVARGLAAGRWRIELDDLAAMDVDVIAGGVALAELVVPRWPAVRGLVMQAGEPRSATVWCRALEEGEPESVLGTASWRAVSEDDGSYAFAIRGSGRHAVWATLREGGVTREVVVDVSPGEVVRVDLEFGTGSLRGRVVRAEDGAPVPRAPVGIAGSQGVKADDDGRFVLDGLLPGPCDVQVRADGRAPGGLSGVVLGDGELRDAVEIVLQPLRISGDG